MTPSPVYKSVETDVCRSPSQHRSRSTSAALRQASVMSGDQSGSGLTIGPNAWLKRKLHLRPQHRGVHLVTEEILAGLPELSQFQVTHQIILCKGHKPAKFWMRQHQDSDFQFTYWPCWTNSDFFILIKRNNIIFWYKKSNHQNF